jgi:glycosyltransferase involved in cell wall biosynthesis
MARHLLFIGGEDHHLRLPFFCALKTRGYRVTAAASGPAEPFIRAGIAFEPISFGRFFSPVRDLSSVRELKSLFERVDADVAHCFDTKLTLLVALAAAAHPRTRLVRTINGRGWIYSSRSPLAFALRALYPHLQRLAAKSTDTHVFEHNGDCSFFTRHVLSGQSRAVVIPGAGIDVAGFEAAQARRAPAEALRRELGLGDAPVVVTVTRITRQKGIPALLKAAQMVHEALPAVKFLLVGPIEGEGPFAVSAAEIERHAGYVIATGARTDVPDLLAMADLFAFPSEYAEGVPRALMEAALSGLPIVATDIAGCREVIRDGWNGRLTPLRDPGALAGAIEGLLRDRDRAREMGSRGPDLIRGVFSLDNVVARHAELYEQILNRGPRGAVLGQKQFDQPEAASLQPR